MSDFQSAEEVFAYLESFTNLERGAFNPREYRLERMRQLLDAFDNPELDYRVLHVAGSKGKGSVCAYATGCVESAGLRVGTYMSPHVSSYLERIRISGSGLNETKCRSFIVHCGDRIRRYVDSLKEEEQFETLPTTFELLTLLAFLVFSEAKIDIAVVEVGLGGRLDATNLVSPDVTVITTIELEHTDYLGSTLEQIAREKAGIIKPGVPLVLGDQPPEARSVILAVAAERGAPVIQPDDLATITAERPVMHPLPANPSPENREPDERDRPRSFRLPLTITFQNGERVAALLRLLGSVQTRNALVACIAVRTLLPALTGEALGRGLSEAWLPGRGELWPGSPPVLLDGAHTPRSVRAVLELAEKLEPEVGRRVLVFGSVSGKGHREMLRLLSPGFAQVIISRPGTFKASDVEELYRVCMEVGAECSRCDDMRDALASARAPDPRLIVVTGSFHLVGEARRVLQEEA